MSAKEKAILRSVLTPPAWERLTHILTRHPELEESILKTLLSLARAGRRNKLDA